jgi:hypothetical protein
MPDALGALLRDDIVEIIRQCIEHLAVKFVLNASGVDGGIRAFRFTRAAVNAFFSDHC